jgi:hypothetical protein
MGKSRKRNYTGFNGITSKSVPSRLGNLDGFRVRNQEENFHVEIPLRQNTRNAGGLKGRRIRRTAIREGGLVMGEVAMVWADWIVSE